MIELDSNNVFEPFLFSSSSKYNPNSNIIIMLLNNTSNNNLYFILSITVLIISITLFYLLLFLKTINNNSNSNSNNSSSSSNNTKSTNGKKIKNNNTNNKLKNNEVIKNNNKTNVVIEESISNIKENNIRRDSVKKTTEDVNDVETTLKSNIAMNVNVHKKKNKNKEDTPDVVYRKTIQQNDTTSQNEISVKSNRKRNQRINEPPPWNENSAEIIPTENSTEIVTAESQTNMWLHNSTENHQQDQSQKVSILNSNHTQTKSESDEETEEEEEEEEDEDEEEENNLSPVNLTKSNNNNNNINIETYKTSSNNNNNNNDDKENQQNYSNTSSSQTTKQQQQQHNKTTSTSSSPNSTLTRRQKKNRIRRNLELNSRIPINKLSKFYQRLSMTDKDLHKYLSHYVLSQQQLINFSFPFESKFYASKAIIYSPGRYNSKILDPKAREFVPGPQQSHHYNVSSNKILLKNQQIMWRPDVEPDKEDDAEEKICARCNKSFFLITSQNDSKSTTQSPFGFEYLTQEHCHYHWGKVTKSWNNGVQNCIYSCCQSEQYKTAGCVYAKLHVWSGLKPGVNGPLEGYVKTKPRKIPPTNGYGVYALDTEMVYTIHGLEVARVTVVNVDGRLIYNTLVKPDCEIIDYNTKYSGISAKDFIKNPFKTLKDVQNDLMGFISRDSIVVGHGLENDLRALKLIHSNIIDTSVLFPHTFGLPYRRSLKSIVSQLLHQSIQGGTHDSFEDARACIDLILWKLLNDFRYNF